MKKQTLLIVDDQREILNSLQRLFKTDYEVLTAASGTEALALLKEHDPAVILSDQRMPEMDGEECLREFTTMAPDIPVVIFSGHTGDDIAIRMLKAGAVSLLSKPVDLNELAGTVRHSIDSARKQSTVKNMQSVT